MSATEPDASTLELLERRFPTSVVGLPSGARVAVRTAGAGAAGAATFVLLHGVGSGAASWLHTALAVVDAHDAPVRVIAWDAPGYGASTPFAVQAPTARDHAGRLHELLAELQVTSCVLVGHSLGALVASALAAGAGRRVVQRLVLISPARGYGAPGEEAARGKVRAQRLRNLQGLGIAGMADQAPARMLSGQADAAARAWVRWNAARLNDAGYLQAVQMLCNDDIGRHTDVAMPVEVHCGDADAVTSPESCRLVAEAFGAPFASIARAGHASPVEQPVAVAGLIVRGMNLSTGHDGR